MRHSLPRRSALHTGLGALALSAAPGLRKLRAQTLRTLTIDTLASVAAVNIPMQQALGEGLAQMPGYGPANAQHTEHITMVTQSVIAGSAEMGDADIIATLAAAEAGADLKIIGLSYNGTSQVIIVNAEKVARIEDLQNPGVSVAVNSIGDFMHVLLIGVLAKRNIDTTKINIVTLGGSNARTRALLAGRVDAVTVHIEQALELMKLGNFKILVRPWDEFPIYFSAGVIATESWLNKPGNAPAAVAYLKAVLTAFRRSNADFPWYGTQFRKLSSSREARAMTDPQIRPGYDILRDQVKAWPDDMGHDDRGQFPVADAAIPAGRRVERKAGLHQGDRSHLSRSGVKRNGLTDGSGIAMTIIRTNTTKAKLRDGTLTLGAVITSPAAEMVEIAAVAGFDFVTFDAEHEPLDDAQLVDLIRVAEAAGITPIVRVAKDGDRILRLLDAGAQGIHAPRCSTPDDMRRLVQWTQFHPRGERTFYRLGRGGHYGRGLDDDTWAAKANAELLVVAMIEEAAALDHLDELLAVPGIDAIHIGPKDLWQSMGMPPAPVVEAAVSRIATAVLRAGKHLSLQLRSIDDLPPQIERAIARQANMISVPLGGLLLQSSEALIRQVRDTGAIKPEQGG